MNNTKTNQTTAPLALVIHWDSCAPSVYGPFKSETEAEQRREEITAKWSEDEWYQAGNGHGIAIQLMSK